MKFALINDVRSEAIKGAKGFCPVCGSELVAKCGELKIHHWAHRGDRNCDPWWENETDWHRSWKNNFPIEWQEIVHYDKKGEKHIADIKTPNEWVIEFQHSFLNPEERRARNAFYGKLIWVVDGTRRKRDMEQFPETLNKVIPFGGKSKIWRVNSSKCVLLREWEESHTPVFFDFWGPQLGWLLESPFKGTAYVALLPREQFTVLHCIGVNQAVQVFDKFVSDIGKIVMDYESFLRKRR
jgi:hypothetical protein